MEVANGKTKHFVTILSLFINKSMQVSKFWKTVMLICISLSSGCVFNHKHYIPTDRPSFFDSEIQSKSWYDPDGKRVVFINSTKTNLSNFGEFLIANFGDEGSTQGRCIELYRVNKPAQGERDAFVLIDHDWGPREQAWWSSVVISIEPIRHADHISFKIVRESIGDVQSKNRLLYYLDYRPIVGVSVNMTELWITGASNRTIKAN